MNGRTMNLRGVTAAAMVVSLGAAGGLLSGCAGYASFPPIAGAPMASTNPNEPPTDQLMAVALEWVVKRYPPRSAGPVVAGQPQIIINLPYGVIRSTYERVASKLTVPAEPLTPANKDSLPIYHVSRVWVRGGDAKVDVLRPLQEVGVAPGQPQAYQQITVFCSGHLEPWHVERFQAWEIGMAQVPAYNYLPSAEWPEPETPTYRAATPTNQSQSATHDMSVEVKETKPSPNDSSGAPVAKPADDGTPKSDSDPE